MNALKKGFRKSYSCSENIVTLIQFEKWEKLIKRLEKRLPEDMVQLRTPGHDCMLPIHWAVKHGPRLPKKALVALVNAFPQSSKAQDDEGSTPLHYAIFYGFANLDIIRILLSRYSEAVLVRDKYGRTPIFHAVAHKIGIKIEALKILLSVEGAAKALTMPCGPITGQYESPAGSRGQCIENIHGRFHRIWKYPEENRTPLYMMWDTAMNAHSSSRWFLKRTSELPKLSGKRMAKALFLLECTHIDRMGRSIDLYQRRRKKMIKKLLNYSEFSLSLQSLGNSQQSLGLSSNEHDANDRFRVKSSNRKSGTISQGSSDVSTNTRIRSRSDNVEVMPYHSLSRSHRNRELLRSKSRISAELSVHSKSVSLRSDTFPRLSHDADNVQDDLAVTHRRSRTQSDLTSNQRKPFVLSIKKGKAAIFSLDRLNPYYRQKEEFSFERNNDGFDPTMSEENSLDEIDTWIEPNHKRGQSLNSVQMSMPRTENEPVLTDEYEFISSRSIRQRIMNRFRVPNVFPIIHACLRLRKFLPEEILDFSLEHYREQLDFEEEGDLPIHLAIELDSHSCDIQKLLAFGEYGAASHKNGRGKLPLHLALMRPVVNHDTVRLLMKAYTLGCLEVEEETHLYPFMLAAVRDCDIGTKSSLTLIYEILLMHPECASYYHQ